jgi:tRNA pseudouridine38-40 synthase
MTERNIRLLIEYRGTAFCGWQSQKDQVSIQDHITDAIRKTTGETVNLIGAGRTDAGVHALGQVANFRITHRLEPEKYRDALNYYLSDDIRIRESSEVPTTFHARFDASFRRYRYLVATRQSAIYRDLRWEISAQLDYDLLRRAAVATTGDHDFAPFCVVASRKENNDCQVDYAQWFRYGPLYIFEIRANRFLHSMVRSLVGAMTNLASVNQDRNERNLTLADFTDILTSSTDERVKFTAPARGLYLVSVGYPEEKTA